MPFLIAAFETAMAAEAAAAVAAASMFGAEVLGAAAVPELAATAAGAEALGTAGTAAAIPEAAMGINAINPELFASAVNSGAVNPATAFSDIPGLADKLANLPAGEALSNPNALAEANRFGASPMATGNMAANPYAQITANAGKGIMPAGSTPLPPASSNALDFNGLGSNVVPPNAAPDFYNFSPETGGGANAQGLGGNIQNTPSPPGFFDKLSDALSPLQKGFQTAQKFAKENPLATGIGSTIADRMFSSGYPMPDTTYKGPLSKFKLSPNFKGRFADPRSFRTAASGGIIDYNEGGTTEKPLVHADMGIAVDNDPDTKYLNPVAAARKRAEKLRKRYGISIPEMQAPTPIDEINVGPRTAAHGGIMQVKRFMEGGSEAGSTSGSDVGSGGEAPGSGTSADYGTPGADTGAMADQAAANQAAANQAAADAMANAAANLAAAESAAPGGVNAPSDAMANAAANLAAAESAAPGGVNYSGGSYGSGGGNYGGGSGGGNGIDSIEPPTTTPTKPKTNIDNLKPQHVNPKDFRSSINSLTPTTDPYAHYKNYNDADYNYLRTPSMPVRNTTTPLPSNIAPSNTSMTDFFNDLRKNNLNTGQINREYGRPENFGSEGSYIRNNNLAQGGIAGITPQGGVSSLGGYARGGMPRLLDGPGDGMSDNIPATINDRQPARLADGEFVIPADVVSHLGNGSTKAGSKRLHLMMDQVRQARTGNPKQGKRINPDKFMPK